MITVEGSPIEVEPCGIIAWLDCSRENSLIFENPLDHTVWIRYRRKYVHDGWWISGWLELPAGGTVDQSGDASTYHHYYQAKTERSDGGGDILVPINGSTAPLVIDQPCEAITLR